MQLTIHGAVTRDEIIKVLDERARRTGYTIEPDSFTWTTADDAVFTLRPLTPEEKEALGLDPAPMAEQLKADVRSALREEFAAFSVLLSAKSPSAIASFAPRIEDSGTPTSYVPDVAHREVSSPRMDDLAVVEEPPGRLEMQEALLAAVPEVGAAADDEAKARSARLRRIREEQKTAEAYDSLTTINPFGGSR